MESWTVIDCFYFVTVSLLTVGYGDVVPSYDGTRLFTVFMIVFGLLFVLKTLNDSASSIVTFLLSSIVRMVHGNGENTPAGTILELKLVAVFVIILVYVVLGIVFIIVAKNRSFISSLYWTVQTMSTVGYGDIPLETEPERIINIFYLLIGLCIFSASLSVYNEVGDEILRLDQREKLLGRAVDVENLSFLSNRENIENGVSKYDFIIGMLLQMGKIDHENDLAPLLQSFSNSNGVVLPTGNKSVVDVKLLVNKHTADTAVQRQQLAFERSILTRIENSLQFKYLSLFRYSATNLLSSFKALRPTPTASRESNASVADQDSVSLSGADDHDSALSIMEEGDRDDRRLIR
eukprot:CAMPEP_0170079336 /NCGR_PEP_ID=MMETSP0019_2-20121128/15742_1 /TAXON_ID=98059 /ORGANISM="Dinobryon sp., Strain UTEXLB2267" /LENGTH=348 /DNA_ID=CAMNT_0010292741 /DNA_START=198 /DNA_END=1244 /DNA_ORIENTATION=+